MITSNLHNVRSVRLLAHQKRNHTTWATVRITTDEGLLMDLTFFEDGAIADVLNLPKHENFVTSFEGEGQ